MRSGRDPTPISTRRIKPISQPRHEDILKRAGTSLVFSGACFKALKSRQAYERRDRRIYRHGHAIPSSTPRHLRSAIHSESDRYGHGRSRPRVARGELYQKRARMNHRRGLDDGKVISLIASPAVFPLSSWRPAGRHASRFHILQTVVGLMERGKRSAVSSARTALGVREQPSRWWNYLKEITDARRASSATTGLDLVHARIDDTGKSGLSPMELLSNSRPAA